ncbi:uncharacterized protein LOC101097801 isoform X2 [Felis catus]|uniref:uncharacterized protein LOC101097801 isoform X2 n=1 Tax=Felis catus TaxID=9685 RepID=UPI001D19A590|nr:uncharacterized protein LOC101097801 isoform X2 [Felis catus]
MVWQCFLRLCHSLSPPTPIPPHCKSSRLLQAQAFPGLQKTANPCKSCLYPATRICQPVCVSAQTIHQWPPVRVQLVGSPLSLECIVKGESNPYLYWYRQAEGGPPQLLFYSLNIHQVDPEAPRNFTASRPQDGQFILSSQKLLLSDSGFYLCAWGLTPSRVSIIRSAEGSLRHRRVVLETVFNNAPGLLSPLQYLLTY